MKTQVILAALIALAPAGAALLTDPFQDDARTGGDAGDSFDEATRLVAHPGSYHASGSYRGMMVVLDDPQDWFLFQAQADTEVNLTITVQGRSESCPLVETSLGSVMAALYSPSGELVDVAVSEGPCAVQFNLYNKGNEQSGDWRIGLSYRGEHSPAGGPFGVAGFNDGSGLSATAMYDMTLGCRPWC